MQSARVTLTVSIALLLAALGVTFSVARLLSAPATTVTESPAPAAPAARANLYVAPAGSDFSQCTRNEPCRTLNRADRLATPGTTVRVAPGAYPAAQLQRSGTAGARIRYVSAKPWAARIRGRSGSAVSVSGAYVDFSGFDVTGTANVATGISLSGDHSRAIGNRVHDMPRSCQPNGGIAAGDAGYRAHDIAIVGNLVHDIGSGPRNGTCHLLHGIYAAVPGVSVINNVVIRALGDGITSWHAATRLTVVNNTIVGNGGDGILIGNGDAGGTRQGNTNSYVANNVIASNFGDAISEGGPHPVFNTFRSNTFFGNGRDILDQWGDSTETDTLIQPPRFVSAANDDYRLQPGDVATGTPVGAPAVDFLGVPRPRSDISRGAFQELRSVDGARAPGTAGTLPAQSSAVGGAPRDEAWPRDAVVLWPRSASANAITVAVRLPGGAMKVSAVATAPGFGRIASASASGAAGETVVLRLRPVPRVGGALPLTAQLELTVEAPVVPPARFTGAVKIG